MGLFIKFKTKTLPNNPIIRFESALKFFNILKNKIPVSKPEFMIFRLEPLEEFNPGMKYEPLDFGKYNTQILKTLKAERFEHQGVLGLEIKGTIEIGKRRFELSYVLNPTNISRRYFDIRIDILPNAHANIFEDLEQYIPNLRGLIFDRIKEYGLEAKTNYPIILAVMAEYGEEEIKHIKNWHMLYTIDPEYLVQAILHSSQEIQETIEMADERKFSYDVMNSQNFILKLDSYTSRFGIAVEQGSLFIKPKSAKAMENFVDAVSTDLLSVSKKVFNPRKKVQEQIEDFFS